MGEQGIEVENVIPVLRVANMAISKAFYITVRGFAEVWGDGELAAVSRDGQSISLWRGDQGSPGSWLWIGVEGLDGFYEVVRGEWREDLQEPTNNPWTYEIQGEDLDRHVLRIPMEPQE